MFDKYGTECKKSVPMRRPGLSPRENPIASGLAKARTTMDRSFKSSAAKYQLTGGIVPLGNLGISIIGPPEIGKVRSPRCRNAGASLAFPHAAWWQAQWVIE